MKNEDVEKCFEVQVDRCRKLLIAKGQLYTVGKDRLCQFKKMADLKNETPMQALAGAMVKHTTLLYDLISGNKGYSIEQWDETITDHLNYLFLLRALLEDTDE